MKHVPRQWNLNMKLDCNMKPSSFGGTKGNQDVIDSTNIFNKSFISIRYPQAHNVNLKRCGGKPLYCTIRWNHPNEILMRELDNH